MSDTLQLGTTLADDAFEVPLDVARYSQALLAVTGSGKSNAAVVLGEQMFRAGIPWVAIDPKGDWYGIRYSAVDGEPGLPIPVFGGLFGNSPLRPEMGARMAELVVELNMTCVLDVSDFDSKNDMLRFVTEFVRTLFRLHARKRTVRHVFLEECDDYMPQKVVCEGDGGKNIAVQCLAMCQKLVKQGRVRGLGCTMISQRPAVVNKDALTQIQTLYVLGMTSPQDRKAIREWVNYHVDATGIVDSLPMLEPGEAWVLSPRVLKRIERVAFKRRWTLDTGATPEFGATASTIGTMATIDMAKIEAALVDVIEQAKETDPLELRKRVAEAEARLAWWDQFTAKLAPGGFDLTPGKALGGRKLKLIDVTRGEPASGTVVQEVEVKIEQLALPARAVEAARVLNEHATKGAQAAAEMLAAMTKEMPPPTVTRSEPRVVSQESGIRIPDPGTSRGTTDRPPEDTPRDIGPPDFSLYETHRRIIAAALERPDATQTQHAFLAGYHAKTKSYTNALGQLRTAGYLQGVRLTAAGEQLAAELGIEPVGDPWDHWYHHPKVPPMGRRVLDRIRDQGPQGMQELADFLGYGNVKTKSFTNLVGLLRGLGLLTKGWPVRLTELMGG